jgi:hypothetical protein
MGMAVGIRFKIAGVTAEQFDQLNAAVDPDGNPPDGLLFHASGPIEDGWGVIDFWESRAHFDRFSHERIGPAMAAIGAAGPQPDIREFPVHEHFPR